jgi:FtsH-binding integral membrane protein
MSSFSNRGIGQTQTTASVDQGLRTHMIKVYNYMASGLALSGLVSWLVMSNPQLASVVMSLNIIWFIATLVMAFAVMPRMMRMSEGGAKLSFYGYAVLLSLMVSPIFLAYTHESVARAFFVTAAVFLSMSLYGYTTKKDLTSFGTFAMIGIWGVFFASIINIFVGSSQVMFITSVVAVVASVALTAYDTQKIKQVYFMVGRDSAAASKAAIMGALQLYFDFVYMFINLLQIMGNRR